MFYAVVKRIIRVVRACLCSRKLFMKGFFYDVVVSSSSSIDVRRGLE